MLKSKADVEKKISALLLPFLLKMFKMLKMLKSKADVGKENLPFLLTSPPQHALSPCPHLSPASALSKKTQKRTRDILEHVWNGRWHLCFQLSSHICHVLIFSQYTPWGPPSKSEKTLYTGIYLPTFREGTHFTIKLVTAVTSRNEYFPVTRQN